MFTVAGVFFIYNHRDTRFVMNEIWSTSWDIVRKCYKDWTILFQSFELVLECEICAVGVDKIVFLTLCHSKNSYRFHSVWQQTLWGFPKY